ncbi:hypothetical protein [Streptomyces sp. NPDC004763]
MTNQTPSRPAYRVPDSTVLAEAVDKALTDTETAHDQLGRVMAAVTAAAVRDALTRNEPGAPFDASAVELVENVDGTLFPSGRYWTMAGAERTLTETLGEADAGNAIHDMSEWTAYLDDATRDTWWPLCNELDDRDGRPAYALDLLRAAAQLEQPRPAQPTGPRRMVEVMVSANEHDRYPALVDPDDQHDGYVRPWFDLDTVRRIAADTQAAAERYGHGAADTVHVLDGSVDGTAHAVVLLVTWMDLGTDCHEQATEILQPNADGRYAVGGHDWCWFALDDDLKPLIPFRPTGR